MIRREAVPQPPRPAFVASFQFAVRGEIARARRRRTARRARLAIAATAAALLMCAAPATPAAANPGLRLGPFIQSVLGERATVLWFSGEEKPGTVRYGLAADKLDRTASSVVRLMPEEVRAKSTFAHETVLTALPAGRDVYYRLTDPADPLGVACFRSDPGPSGTIQFVCGGDEVYFDPYLPFLKARGIRLDLVVDSGDYQSRVGRYGRPWWREIPVYISWGNHNIPATEKHWWALPGDKVGFDFELGPALFAFSTRSADAKANAGWKIAAGHSEVISNGKGANSTNAAANFAAAGFALRCNGNDHHFDRTYPVRGDRRDPSGTVFLTHGGYSEPTKLVRPAVSNYYGCSADVASLLPLVTVSPGRLELRVLLHRDGEFLPEKEWPRAWPGRANPPRDYPHEWDYYVRVKDPQYAGKMVEAIRAAIKAGKTDEGTLAVVRELGGLVESGAVEPLTELLKLATDTKLRREIALALDRIGEPRAMPALKTLAGDRDPMARIAVARFFAKFGNERDAADLAAFAKDDEDAGGNHGPATVCPQKYYAEGLMLRIGGPLACRLAPELLDAAPHYADYVLRMLMRDESERKLPALRALADRLLAVGARLDRSTASLANALGPIAQGPEDVARLVRLGEKLNKGDGWEGIAAGLSRNGSKEHVRLLVKGYRQVAPTTTTRLGAAAAIRKALQELTGLELPDPVVGAGKQTTLDRAKVNEGARLAEEWADKRAGDNAVK